MSCDAYIKDKNRKAKITIRCYSCGKEVDLNNPMKGHKNCYSNLHGDEYDNCLPIVFDYENLFEL